jgi:alpha-maltose-1-phosphate synthase
LKITISHPHGNPNSFHAAEAFAEAGWLCSFQRGFNGNGLLGGVGKNLPGDVADRLMNRQLANVPPHQQRQHLSWETISRVGRKIKPSGFSSQVNWNDVLFCGHDLQVSRQLESGLHSVYAYEDGARWTFTAAKRKQTLAIYELPLGYFGGVAHEIETAKRRHPDLPVDYQTEPEWKQQRKNAELALADVVVVPCEWARESLRFSTAKPQNVVTVPYGTPASEVSARTRRPDGPFTVLFAGQVGMRKGVPLLLEAWNDLQFGDAQLRLAGSMGLDEAYINEFQNVSYVGPVSRTRLLELMAEADLLVLPSVAEGFGLVIGEAMAVGVPVLTTRNTGGPELITEGREGWCITAHDSEALSDRIRWSYQNRDQLWTMGVAARRAAERWTWSHYRQLLIEKIRPFLNY